MKRGLALVVLAVCGAAGAWWYVAHRHVDPESAGPAAVKRNDHWLDALYSQNPRDVEAATQEVAALGAGAIPLIQSTLRDPHAEAERLKAALKACGILGKVAAPAVADVASVLQEPGLTAEAALALSYMGRDALAPLREALSSEDAIVRREALRSIGKLKERAPLDSASVIPLLIARMKDPDDGVRTVAATYLGIIQEASHEAVPALVAALADSNPEVRAAAAAALGSFGAAAAPAMPALKKAATDHNDDVAREAGRAVLKLQGK